MRELPSTQHVIWHLGLSHWLSLFLANYLLVDFSFGLNAGAAINPACDLASWTISLTNGYLYLWIISIGWFQLWSAGAAINPERDLAPRALSLAISSLG
jgi:glycerol uptake facilitator-like aquaporin